MGAHTGRCFRARRRTAQRKARQAKRLQERGEGRTHIKLAANNFLAAMFASAAMMRAAQRSSEQYIDKVKNIERSGQMRHQAR